MTGSRETPLDLFCDKEGLSFSVTYSSLVFYILKLDEANEKVVSKVESQLPLGFNSEVESYLYPRFNLGQLSVVKVRGWLNLLGIVLASKNEHLLIF